MTELYEIMALCKKAHLVQIHPSPSPTKKFMVGDSQIEGRTVQILYLDLKR